MKSLIEVASPIVPPHKFSVRIEPKPSLPGVWNSTIVTVLQDGEAIGSYERNYPSHAEDTFCPFLSDGRWFALYSRDYTATRVMSLPDCKDIGGEEGCTDGFCPVELWVPAYRVGSHDWERVRQCKDEPPQTSVTRLDIVFWPGEEACMDEFAVKAAKEQETGERPAKESYNYALGPWESCPFGFVAGCVWGDDSSWKIQLIDLAKVAQGVIKREEAFGYIELPRHLKLREAIDLEYWKPGSSRIGVTHTTIFDIEDCKT